MRTCSIIGAGGHAHSLMGLLRRCAYTVNALYDNSFDPQNREEVQGVGLLGPLTQVPTKETVVLAVGDNARRQSLFECYQASLLKTPLLHPDATVEDWVNIGAGTQVFARALINCDVQIAANCIINSGCIVEHESQVGAHSHVAVGAVLCGRVHLGERVLIGAGAVVNPGVSICDDVVVGSGAVVSRDITEAGVYTGIPAGRRG